MLNLLLVARSCCFSMAQLGMPAELPPTAPRPMPSRPAPTEGAEVVEPNKVLPELRVKLVPSVNIETVPHLQVGPIEYGATRPDVAVRYREERQKVVTMRPRTVERTVQVMTRQTIFKGDVDPTTGEEATATCEVMVPKAVSMKCQVLEAVTEEVVVRVPEIRKVESPVVVRRMGSLSWDKPMVVRRFEGRVFTDPLALPPCVEGGPPVDPLGRPESPEPSAGRAR